MFECAFENVKNSRQRHGRPVCAQCEALCVEQEKSFLVVRCACTKRSSAVTVPTLNIWNIFRFVLVCHIRTSARSRIRLTKPNTETFSWILSVDYCAPNNLCIYFFFFFFCYLCRHRKVIIYNTTSLMLGAVEYRNDTSNRQQKKKKLQKVVATSHNSNNNNHS